jgi:hypothetical protein
MPDPAQGSGVPQPVIIREVTVGATGLMIRQRPPPKAHRRDHKVFMVPTVKVLDTRGTMPASHCRPADPGLLFGYLEAAVGEGLHERGK